MASHCRHRRAGAASHRHRRLRRYTCAYPHADKNSETHVHPYPGQNAHTYLDAYASVDVHASAAYRHARAAYGDTAAPHGYPYATTTHGHTAPTANVYAVAPLPGRRGEL